MSARGGAGTFVVVDGTALAYRSHFAFANRPLTTRKGEPTSAVFGFILSLRKILETLSPDRVAVVFDPPGPTFRHTMYGEYKATRERMSDDLRAQLPWIDRWLDAAGIRRISVPGVEADDVMATLALRAASHGFDARIVSNDKDLAQVVRPGVAVVTMGKATDPPRVLGRDEVVEQYGVPPERIVDLLTLTGDSSDNVPGVPGIGPKTAAKLLAEHGSLERLLEAAPAMKPGKTRDSLLAARETIPLSRTLVTLKTDVDVGVSPEDLARVPESPDALAALYDELEFSSLRREVSAAKRSDVSGYRKIDSMEGVRELVERLRSAGRFAFDTETTSIDPMRAELVGLSFCAEAGVAFYLPVAHANAVNLDWEKARPLLAALLEDERIPKWGQNVKYDLLVLRRHGVRVRGIDFDTMLASYALDPSRRSHSLDELARDRLGIETIPLTSLIGTGKSQILISQAPLDDVVTYAAEDADVALRLRSVLEPEVLALGLEPLLRTIEMPLVHVLADMEEAGVRLDVEFLKSLSTRMAEELAVLEKEAWAAAGLEFNLGSPKQVADLLFNKLGLAARRRTKTGLSTDAETLEELADAHPVPRILLRHREVAKLKSTYVDALPALVNPGTGRLHTSYNQAVAATGRLSSSDPNLQNVPVRTWEGREIRKAFIAADERSVLVSCDYSQIELRILAHMAQDEPLLEAFREDVDVHRVTASLVFDVSVDRVTAEQRAQAKTINFGVIYGMGPVNLGRSLGISTKEAAQFIDAYFARYPGVRAFIDRSQEAARRELVVSTLAGRRRPIPEAASLDPRTRAFGERIAVNTPIQGTAADILKIAMIRAHDAIAAKRLRGRMILTVHDELVFDVPEEEREELTRLAVESMEGAMRLSVPLKVETGFGKHWSDAH
jgi:DNA polymerase-1